MPALAVFAFSSASCAPAAQKTAPTPAAKAAARLPGNFRTAVFLNETSPEPGTSVHTAARALEKALAGLGLTVVDRRDLRAFNAAAAEAALQKGDAKPLATLGKRLGAEILVMGAAGGRRITDPALGDMVSVRATLSAKAYRSQSGQILGSTVESASAIDASLAAAAAKAFAAAAQNGAASLGPQIAETLSRQGRLSIVATGIENMSRLNQFEEALAKAAGTRAIALRSFVGGEALIDIPAAGESAQEIAAVLEKTEGLNAKIQGITDATIHVAVLAQP